MAGASIVSKACQNHARFHFTHRFQLVHANAVHTLQQRISAGQQQRSKMRACKNGTQQMSHTAGDPHPDRLTVDAKCRGIISGELIAACIVRFNDEIG